MVEQIAASLEQDCPFLTNAKWEEGSCPTFALGLHLALTDIGVQSEMVAGVRNIFYRQEECEDCDGCRRCEDVGEPDETTLSHVVVSVGQHDFDYMGGAASERWEAKFWDLYETECRVAEIFDSPPPSEFEFEWRPVSADELKALSEKYGALLCFDEASQVRSKLLPKLLEYQG